LGPQSQVSTQAPLTHVLPAAQVTAAQLFATHLPAAHACPAPHATPAHGSGGRQVNAQALPGPQLASHAVKATQAPVCGWQVWPVGQVTPLQGAAKHPATQRPPMQVWSLAQETP